MRAGIGLVMREVLPAVLENRREVHDRRNRVGVVMFVKTGTEVRFPIYFVESVPPKTISPPAASMGTLATGLG